MEEMARVAVDMLIAKERGDGSGPAQSQHRVLPHQLLVRDSTSAPSVKSTLDAKRRN
jgi:LacI family transcriptional regulator